MSDTSCNNPKSQRPCTNIFQMRVEDGSVSFKPIRFGIAALTLKLDQI